MFSTKTNPFAAAAEGTTSNLKILLLMKEIAHQIVGTVTYTIHVWYVYLYGTCIGKNTNPMDPMG